MLCDRAQSQNPCCVIEHRVRIHAVWYILDVRILDVRILDVRILDVRILNLASSVTLLRESVHGDLLRAV